MAIKRFKRRNPTLIANPRKRKARKARRSRKTRVLRANPRRRVRRNPPRLRRVRRRNPGLTSFNVAGVPVLEVGLGAAGAIALIQGVMAIPFVKEQASKDSAIAKLVGPGLAFGAGWAAYKYIKNPMVKNIGKYACLAAVVIGVNELAGVQIREAVANLTDKGKNAGLSGPGLNGAYLLADSGKGAVGGAYVQAPKAFGARSFT